MLFRSRASIVKELSTSAVAASLSNSESWPGALKPDDGKSRPRDWHDLSQFPGSSFCIVIMDKRQALLQVICWFSIHIRDTSPESFP